MGMLIHDGERVLQSVFYPVAPTYPETVTADGQQYMMVPQAVIDTLDLSAVYVEEGELAERPAITLTISQTDIVADGVDTAAFAGLPVPCEVTVDGEPYVVEDGKLNFRTDEAGTYRLTFDAWPHIGVDCVVTARAT
jgi:hypothetical protein